jgi:type VI secretion system protein VasG
VLTIREKLWATTEATERESVLKELKQADRELDELQKAEGLIQIEVTPEVVARVVSDWTGIPLGKVQKDEAKTVVDLETHLGQRIKGQDQALQIMSEVIQSAKAGIKNPNQPMGVFLLVGPSGVGKTETGLVLADLLFGSEKNVVTINMSEFQEGHTISRLIGSPPGYVGFGEGGMLTEAIRQKPYSVVLLDEVEKAHLDVMNLFYQVFDKGTLTDGEGKEINFKNTIMILTSNLASDIIQEMTTADPSLPLDTLAGAIRPVLSQHFKPALLARMTVVPFISLNPDVMKLIVELKLKSVQKTIRASNKMEFTYTPAVIDQIAARCTEVETGARNIEYILNTNILPKLSRSILSQMSEKELPKSVKLKVDKTGAFTFTFGN